MAIIFSYSPGKVFLDMVEDMPLIMVEAGDGSVSLCQYTLRNGDGVIVLSDCQEKHPVGSKITAYTEYCKVHISFKNIKSLDILIEHLQTLRVDMLDKTEIIENKYEGDEGLVVI